MDEENMIKKENKKEEESEKRKKLLIILILLLLLLLMITVGTTLWALFFRDTTPVLAPDYAPQQSEQNAEQIEGDSNQEKLEQPEGGGAVSLSYSKEVTIDLSEKKAKLLFANPYRSNQDMLIQIVIHDTVILQSGILSPGNRVRQLDLFDNVKLSEGIYEGKFVIYYYQKDSGEKAMINTEIPLSITVKE